jgi:periodic tryptophan protein 2
MATHALVVGHRSGEFCVYDASRIAARFSRGIAAQEEAEGDDVSLIHTMSLGNATVSAASFSASGEWIALGVARLGAYVVWEWRTESFILKQQGHAVGYTVRSISHSPDGQVLASGGDDGKVKVWSATSGQCFVTFAEHASAVTAVRFSPRGHVVFSASLDGTARAFDLVRYRNFRTFVTPGAASEQLTCLAVDGSGDIIAAGSSSSFTFYVWSVKSGACTDVLSGHTGPVSSLAFGGTDQSLATVSWDGTLRVWNLFGRGGASSSEAYSHAAGGNVGSATSDGTVLAVTWRPDGRQLATATLNGQLYLWAPAEGVLEGLIDGAADLAGATDGIARRGQDAAHFSTISYSPDGTFLLAAGLTKFVCMYSVENRTLLARWQLSTNPSLLGVIDRFNETAALRGADGARWAALRVSDDEDDELDGGEASARAGRFAMPGVTSGPHAEGAARGSVAAEAVAMRCAAVEFAPTGATFAAATPEGIMVYGRGARRTFDPIAVDESTTPAAARAAAAAGRVGEAWEAALRLRAPRLLISLLPAVPLSQAPLVVSQLPRELLPAFVSTLAASLDSRSAADEGAAPSRHVELVLLLLAAVFRAHGAAVRADPLAFAGPLRAVRRALADPLDQLHSLVTENSAEIRYLVQHVAE